MTFGRPWFLLALGVLPVLLWIHRTGIGAVPARQRRAALAARMTMAACTVLALAGTSIKLPERRPATVFVLDHSDSIPAPARERADAFARRALRAKPAKALAGVVVAGAEPRVELSVQEHPELLRIGTDPDGSRTDLSRALRLAGALLPEGMRRRIVLLSDGRQNSGDALTEATRLAHLRIPIDTVTISSPGGPDVAVSSVKAPAKVRVGEEFQLAVELQANASFSGARLVTRRNGEIVDTRELDIRPGGQRLAIDQTASVASAASYSVEVQHDRDTIPENDSGSALVVVSGPPRVLVLEGQADEGSFLERALSDRGLSVVRRSIAGFPSTDELAGIDTIVLVDVDAASLLESQMDTLAGFVRDMGRGLVAVGGEHAWSLGGYRNTVLEDLLPVTSEIKDPKRRPSIAQVVVLDSSGSMAESPGGANKIEIAKAAAVRAADALSGDDQFGVLAFNTSSSWVIPLGKMPQKKLIREKVAALAAGGGTDIPQAITAAAGSLRGARASLKHIVLMSDGFNGAGDLLAAATDAKKDGITLSVVGTGESAAQDLEAIAEAGGGRFYPGRDLSQIPEIVLSEVMTAARRYVNEGVFYPAVKGDSPATRHLNSAPPILGYIGTTSKPAATTLLTVNKFDDPLLATWRTGLGVASAWTSDAKPRWSAGWIGWEGFADFWSDVVRETLPAAATPGFSSSATTGETGLDLKVESESEIPEGVRGLATVLEPDGAAHKVELKRTGLNSFGAAFPAEQTGGFLISLELSAGTSAIYRDSIGAVKPYSAEYSPGNPDRALLKGVARISGGRYGIKPQAAFRPGPAPGWRPVDVSDVLLVTAAFLLVADIALRRLTVNREDFVRALSRRHASPPAADSRSRSMERLLRAKIAAGRKAGAPGSASPPDRDGPEKERTIATGSRSAGPDRESGRKRSEPQIDQPGPGTPSGAAELLRRKREREGPRAR